MTDTKKKITLEDLEKAKQPGLLENLVIGGALICGLVGFATNWGNGWGDSKPKAQQLDLDDACARLLSYNIEWREVRDIAELPRTSGEGHTRNYCRLKLQPEKW